MNNSEIAEVFQTVAGLLEMKGEPAFTVRAYRQGAATLRELAESIEDMVREGNDLRALPGIGKAISDKTRALVDTGTFPLFERLKSEFPPGIVELLRVHGLGPTTVKRVWEELGVTTPAGLEEAARDGRLASLPRFSQRSAERVLKEVERFRAGVDD